MHSEPVLSLVESGAENPMWNVGPTNSRTPRPAGLGEDVLGEHTITRVGARCRELRVSLHRAGERGAPGLSRRLPEARASPPQWFP